MFILKKGHQPGVYVPLRALFLVIVSKQFLLMMELELLLLQAENSCCGKRCNVLFVIKGISIMYESNFRDRNYKCIVF